MKFKNGPNNVAVGFTQASVSANNNPLPDVIATPTLSESDEAIIGSIIDNSDDVLVVVVTGDVGTTKAETPLIVIVIVIVVITQNKVTERRHILNVDCFLLYYQEIEEDNILIV